MLINAKVFFQFNQVLQSLGTIYKYDHVKQKGLIHDKRTGEKVVFLRSGFKNEEDCLDPPIGYEITFQMGPNQRTGCKTRRVSFETFNFVLE